MTPEQQLQYENQGFLHLPGVIEPQLLARLRSSFDLAAAKHRPAWEQNVAAGKADSAYYDIPCLLDQDDAFVELVDMPSTMPVLLKAVGPDIQLNQCAGRLMMPGDTFTAPWHSDLANIVGIDMAHSIHFFVKIHYYIEDLLPDQGCLAFIPGTHRLPVGHPRPALPGTPVAPTVTIVPKAGDAVLFNAHVLHMCLANDTPIERKSIIYTYSHFWVKSYDSAVPSDLERHVTTNLRRQLFGVEEAGVSYFDRRFDQNADTGLRASLTRSRARLSREVSSRLPKNGTTDALRSAGSLLREKLRTISGGFRNTY